ncbi:MAG: ECF transporter S component [Treponema porcinum]|nr:ECF transporter S component [Treponema porcinum]MCI7115844.1 ECF transporter S component [Treponema porcinum]MCI7534678.1 ECF transporter S component [Treponema porcinum]MCI7545981.1 ECF transporter S component [Treponema porcinum]MDD6899025.1 ECF transporter S component [Treponema porcinum]MDY5046269.1 ECF transporter S component [Treponema porcinum]
MKLTSISLVASKNRRIAITGAFSALIILMGIPGLHLGYIQLSPAASLTIMHIPVILAAILAGLPGGIITGLVFGLTSLVNAAANPSGILDPLFVNPFCSVLPRMLFGAAAWGVFRLLSMIPVFPKALCAAVTSFLTTLLHTVMVIGSMYVFLNSQMSETMGGMGFVMVMGVILPGALLEAAAATFVCAAVTAAMSAASGKKAKIFSEENKD